MSKNDIGAILVRSTRTPEYDYVGAVADHDKYRAFYCRAGGPPKTKCCPHVCKDEMMTCVCGHEGMSHGGAGCRGKGTDGTECSCKRHRMAR